MNPEAKEKIRALVEEARAIVEKEAGPMLVHVRKAAEGGLKNNPEWEHASDIWWRVDFVGELLRMTLVELENVKPVAVVRMRERKPAAGQPVVKVRLRERIKIQEAAE